MPVSLNLLPPELAVSKQLGGALKTIRALSVIFLAAFIVFAVGMSAYFIFESISLSNITNNTKDLETQIKQQETSEQQIVLLKNRIGKIMLVQKQPSAQKNLTTITPFLETLPSEASISELNVDSQKVGLSVAFKSNAALTDFFQTVSASTAFKSVVLSSFGFSPVSGYLMGLDIVGK